MAHSDQERAEKSAQAMWEADAASQDLGLSLVQVAPGQSRVSLRVEGRHLNGHGTCHGGIIFTLADTAFAFACNSYNQLTVGQAASISYIKPGQLDDTLTAEAREVSRNGRSGLYDISVRNQAGDQIAEFRGQSRSIPGQHFEETK